MSEIPTVQLLRTVNGFLQSFQELISMKYNLVVDGEHINISCNHLSYLDFYKMWKLYYQIKIKRDPFANKLLSF